MLYECAYITSFRHHNNYFETLKPPCLNLDNAANMILYQPCLIYFFNLVMGGRNAYRILVGTDGVGDRGEIPGRELKGFVFHYHVQTGSGAHPASYLVGTVDSFPGSKATGE